VTHDRANLEILAVFVETLSLKSKGYMMYALTAHLTPGVRSCNELHELSGDFWNIVFVTLAILTPPVLRKT
jgi:hypothetical protein